MIESAPLFSKKKGVAWKAERTYSYQKKALSKAGLTFVKSYGVIFNGYYLFWILERLLPKKVRVPLQNIAMKIFGKIDLALSYIPFLKFLYYPKVMVFQKR